LEKVNAKNTAGKFPEQLAGVVCHDRNSDGPYADLSVILAHG